MRISILDYGTGNLHSLAKALQRRDADVRITTDVGEAIGSDALVLPGVGAFADASGRLQADLEPLREALRSGLPCLGICLGMQLLFDKSAEGPGSGIGAFAGGVRHLRARKVPHMGWNDARGTGDPLLTGIDGEFFYYANSFVVEPVHDTEVIAWTEYDGERFPAAVRRGRTVGVQFHPEKSGPSGIRLLENFLDEVQP